MDVMLKNKTELKLGFLMSIYAAQPKADVTETQPYEINNYF